MRCLFCNTITSDQSIRREFTTSYNLNNYKLVYFCLWLVWL